MTHDLRQGRCAPLRGRLHPVLRSGLSCGLSGGLNGGLNGGLRAKRAEAQARTPDVRACEADLTHPRLAGCDRP